MKPDPHSRIVIGHLGRIGYDAEFITQEASADIWAYRGEESFVVEVKSRIDDADTVKEVREAPIGTIVEREGSLGRKNRMSAVVEKAAAQVTSTLKSSGALSLLWFRAVPEIGLDDSEEQMIATLLGKRWGMWKRGAEYGPTTFYAADYTDFFRFTVLDAAVVEVSGEKGRLVINPYSPRKHALEKTHLYGFFSESGGVLDIETLEPPNTFVLRGHADRSDLAAVQKAFCEQYPGYQFVLSDMQSYGSAVQVQLPKEPPY